MLLHHFASEFLIHTPSAAPLPFPAPRRRRAPSREQSGCRTCPRDGSSPSPSFLPSSLSLPAVPSLSPARPCHLIPSHLLSFSHNYVRPPGVSFLSSCARDPCLSFSSSVPFQLKLSANLKLSAQHLFNEDRIYSLLFSFSSDLLPMGPRRGDSRRPRHHRARAG